MEEVDEELWKLGVYAKTEHKEVAPCQFEIGSCIFHQQILANDQNQIDDGSSAKSSKSSWPGMFTT